MTRPLVKFDLTRPFRKGKLQHADGQSLHVLAKPDSVCGVRFYRNNPPSRSDGLAEQPAHISDMATAIDDGVSTAKQPSAQDGCRMLQYSQREFALPDGVVGAGAPRGHSEAA